MAKLERTEKPINVLLEEWKRGELALPEIQRGYVSSPPKADVAGLSPLTQSMDSKVRTNLTTAGISRERYFELLDKV